MNWNNLYKGILSIFTIIPLILANNEEILELKSTDDISILKDFKELKILSIDGHVLTQEDVNALCDLNNLEDLTLKFTPFEEGINYECIKNLTKLKKLNAFINFDESQKEIFKYFPNLESLYVLNLRKYYQEEFESIIAMKNLKELNLDHLFNNEKDLDLEAITVTSNVRKLDIYFYGGMGLTPNFFNIFSQVEELYFKGHSFNQQEVDNIKTLLKNLKKLDIGINCSCKDLIPIDFGIVIYNEMVNKAKAKNSFAEYYLNHCMRATTTIIQDNVNELCNLNKLEYLTISSFEEDINFECLKDLEIKHLNITTEERPKELLEYFPNLETLTLNSVDTFYQEELENIVAMKNLKILTLNKFDKSNVDFEAITDTSNIRRMEIYSAHSKLDMHLTPNFFKIFSQVEEFDLIGQYFDQEEINGFKTLKNLKEIKFGMVLCKDNIELDLGDLKNILKFGYYSMGYVDYSSYFSANCMRREGIKEDGNYVYIYNANRNQCLHSDGKNGAVTYGDCNDKLENILWVNGSRIFYAANPNCCFAGTRLTCGEYCVYGTPAPSRNLEFWISNKHINRAPDGSSHLSGFGPTNICLGSKDENSNELDWKECDDYDPDQIWEFNQWNSTTGIVPAQEEEEPPLEEYIYIYNADRNECLTTSGIFGSPITYGKCDSSDNTVWITSNSNNHIRSKGNPKLCLRPNNVNSEGGAILGKCSPIAHRNQFYRSDNFIRFYSNSSYDRNCIGSSKDDPNKTALMKCDEKDPDQIWYFNKWDPSVVVKETAIVYFYNAFKNECIHTDGSTVTMGSCDFNDDSLWEIPNSHKGYYRSKANPEKCLSIVDDTVSLTDCNEDTTLYLDGNFIRSTSSKDHCIASSKSDNTLEYVEGCDINDTDHIWYVNIWTPVTDAE